MGRMVHIPINHPLQPLYRLISGAVGVYLVAFGAVGVSNTGGLAFFARKDLPSSLGLHGNLAFAILSIIVGAVVLAGAVIGGNVAKVINIWGSGVFIVAGLVMLVLLRTDVNFLGFTPQTCIVSMIIGMALLVAGLYGKVGSNRDIWREEQFRHGKAADPGHHKWSQPNPMQDPVEEWHESFMKR
jgi:hypothetical protein